MHVLLLLTTALAGKMPLAITVTGVDGAPLPSTMIHFHDEAQTHVMTDEGTFQTESLIRQDGSTRDLWTGGKVTFDVFAPGHGPMLMQVELKPGKVNRARARLSPSNFHTAGNLAAIEAVSLARRWETAQLKWWAERTEANEVAANRLRAATASKARAWLEDLGDAPHSDATRLCRMTAPDISICGEE